MGLLLLSLSSQTFLLSPFPLPTVEHEIVLLNPWDPTPDLKKPFPLRPLLELLQTQPRLREPCDPLLPRDPPLLLQGLAHCFQDLKSEGFTEQLSGNLPIQNRGGELKILASAIAHERRRQREEVKRRDDPHAFLV